MPFDPNQLTNYPLDSGVYLMKNDKGEVIYVGKANSLQVRLKQYFIPGRDTRKTIPLLISELMTIDTVVVSGEKEALLLENTLIKKYRPKFNILLRDDKNYISLSLNLKDKWPKLTFSRFTSKPNDGALYFGPYTSSSSARQIFDLMAKLFPLRQCSDEEFKRRVRPCLLYDIKRCLAPCVLKCDESTYKTYVDGAIAFLQGNNKKVLQELEEKMHIASAELEFEKAASLLRTIRQIEHVTESANLSSQAESKNIDVLGFYCKGHQVLITRLLFRHGSFIGSEPFLFQNIIEENTEVLTSFILQQYGEKGSIPQEILLPFPIAEEKLLFSILKDIHGIFPKLFHPKKGEKLELLALAQKNAETSFIQKTTFLESSKELLLKLQETLSLSRYPKRIECFDTSNLSGSHLVAAVVCFIDGVLNTQKTRLYHIKGIDKPDDYAALHQVLTRSLLRNKEEESFPDLLIIDGGKGQLNIALTVLKELDIINVDVISLVKDKARHDKGITLERVYTPYEEGPISFPFHSPLLFLLQNIRDKAHEKAISFHRKTRAKEITKSAIDSIPGIGPIKKKNLLRQFGSLQNILAQSEESLQQVPGLTKKDIINIKKFAF